MQALFKKRSLKPGTVITVDVIHAGMTGKRFTLIIKKRGQPTLKTASV